jgi:hypothetical protein
MSQHSGNEHVCHILQCIALLPFFEISQPTTHSLLNIYTRMLILVNNRIIKTAHYSLCCFIHFQRPAELRQHSPEHSCGNVVSHC